ncbi:hypothetical protein ZWY2020_053770 [Hordeum vulgare]|nr:hypothetical protein ZWY2020_053770 [Hordeum vulgare]
MDGGGDGPTAPVRPGIGLDRLYRQLQGDRPAAGTGGRARACGRATDGELSRGTGGRTFPPGRGHGARLWLSGRQPGPRRAWRVASPVAPKAHAVDCLPAVTASFSLCGRARGTVSPVATPWMARPTRSGAVAGFSKLRMG